MSNIANKFKNRLKDKLVQENSLKIKSSEELLEKEIQITALDQENLKDIIDFNLLDTLDTDKKTMNFLRENTIKIFSIQSKCVIELGKVLSDVYETLAKTGSKDGVYTKWLEISGVSPRTALNYRKRYSLYESVNEDGKIFVSKIPQKLVDLVCVSETKEEYIAKINEGISRIELEKEIEYAIEKKASASLPKVQVIEEFDFCQYIEIFKEIDSKVKSLEDNKRLEVKKYLDKVIKLLNS
ncbi:hypothetical protein [Cetobacterium sp.]|uniref:hypothetical protein n=1 Tax=Cetobacterium sp. TaxID=2071632 RepID=UPI002FCA8122